jgi:RNA 2',3'-cyclic 3'-phosphodiesterase
MSLSRLFIAINLSEHVQNSLNELQNIIRKQLKTNIFRWLKQSNRHITLHFLGNVPSRNITELKEILDIIISRYTPFDLHIKNIGFFPHKKKPRVFWAGIEAKHTPLQKIHDVLTYNLLNAHYTVDTRPYVPHLTLAYIKKSVDYKAVLQAIDIIESLNIECIDYFRVVSLDLMESHLGQEGSQHTTIYTACF